MSNDSLSGFEHEVVIVDIVPHLSVSWPKDNKLWIARAKDNNLYNIGNQEELYDDLLYLPEIDEYIGPILLGHRLHQFFHPFYGMVYVEYKDYKEGIIRSFNQRFMDSHSNNRLNREIEGFLKKDV